MKFIASFFVVFGMIISIAKAEDHCYQDIDNPYRYYSIHTTYEDAGNIMEQQSDCEAESIYFVSRSGAHYPSRSVMEEIRMKLPEIRNRINESSTSTLCDLDIEELDYWEPHFLLDDADVLSEPGKNDLQAIARRFKLRYPTLQYDDWDVLFGQGDKTYQSAAAFTNTWYKEETPVRMSTRDDWIVSFNTLCEKYKISEDNSAVDGFKYGPEMKTLVDTVKNRLGLDTLTLEGTLLMYKACYYEWATQRESPWCAAFEDNDLKTLEYLEDLSLYWSAGYAQEINYQQACPMLSDMLRHFGDVKKGTSDPHLASRFVEYKGLAAFIARLGLLQDDFQLSANTAHKDRNWIGRTVAPFAGNIAIVLANCGGTYKVQARLNEHLISLPQCASSTDWCDYESVSSAWRQIAQDCNMETICKLDDTDQTKPPASSSCRNVLVKESFVMMCLFLILRLS